MTNLFLQCNGAKYENIGSNSTESKGLESDAADCLGTGCISAESKAACSVGDNSMATEFKETNLCVSLLQKNLTSS